MSFMKGRMNRATYWLTIGLIAILYLAFNLMGGKHVAVSEGVLIVICVPRLHDIGKSGWWAGAFFLLEIAVAVAAFSALSLDAAKAVLGLFVLVLVGFLVWLGSIPGQPEPNHFGEPPAPGIQFKARPKSS